MNPMSLYLNLALSRTRTYSDSHIYRSTVYSKIMAGNIRTIEYNEPYCVKTKKISDQFCYIYIYIYIYI
jgi:hypothetical protein